jgi:hypothetical protein
MGVLNEFADKCESACGRGDVCCENVQDLGDEIELGYCRVGQAINRCLRDQYDSVVSLPWLTSHCSLSRYQYASMKATHGLAKHRRLANSEARELTSASSSTRAGSPSMSIPPLVDACDRKGIPWS